MPFYNPLRSRSGGIIQTLGDVSQKHKWEHKERGGGGGAVVAATRHRQPCWPSAVLGRATFQKVSLFRMALYPVGDVCASFTHRNKHSKSLVCAGNVCSDMRRRKRAMSPRAPEEPSICLLYASLGSPPLCSWVTQGRPGRDVKPGRILRTN